MSEVDCLVAARVSHATPGITQAAFCGVKLTERQLCISEHICIPDCRDMRHIAPGSDDKGPAATFWKARGCEQGPADVHQDNADSAQQLLE